jgi:hypothetical protein
MWKKFSGARGGKPDLFFRRHPSDETDRKNASSGHGAKADNRLTGKQTGPRRRKTAGRNVGTCGYHLHSVGFHSFRSLREKVDVRRGVESWSGLGALVSFRSLRELKGRVCLKETQCPITRRHAIGQSADRCTKQILLDFRCITYMDEIVGDYWND